MSPLMTHVGASTAYLNASSESTTVNESPLVAVSHSSVISGLSGAGESEWSTDTEQELAATVRKIREGKVKRKGG